MGGDSQVEVRKNPRSTTWYNAVVLDVRGESVRVAFDQDVWPRRDVPAYSVRRCPRTNVGAEDSEVPAGVDGFEPKEDEVVEVFVQATESSPSGWALGRVKTIKDSFYFIGFLNVQRGSQDIIVERSALRPCSGEPALEPGSLVRKVIPVDEELQEWLRSPDSEGCLSHVRTSAGLLVSGCIGSDPDAEVDPEVLLVGEPRAVDLAERLLVQIHFPNQLQMQRFHEQREQLLQRLEENQRRFKALHREVFAVDQGLVGKLIGKKGENIRRVRDEHGVEISVQDEDQRAGRHKTTITITGEDADAVRRARDDLEFVTEKVGLKSEQVGWILGKGYQNIQDIARKTELHYARFEDGEGCLELCGLKHQVEDARMLIKAHMEYQQVYRNMDEEQHAIRQSFERLDAVAVASGVPVSSGRGRGGGATGATSGRGSGGGGGGGRGGGSGAAEPQSWRGRGAGGGTAGGRGGMRKGGGGK